MALPVYLSGGRIQGRSDDALLTAVPQTSWKELGRTTLSSTSNTIDVTSLASKDNLMVIMSGGRSSGNDVSYRYNADTGSNYAGKENYNGGSDNNYNSQNHNRVFGGGTMNFDVQFITNKSNKEKRMIGHGTHSSTGAGSVPTRVERVQKWANTSDSISQVNLFNLTAGNFDSGAEVVVLGMDNDEADSGTNFWQELTVKELSSAGDTIDTGTFTAKKYLKVDVFIKATSAVRTQFQFRSDTSSSYVNRNSKNGGSDTTNTSQAKIYLNDHERSSDGYSVAYITNVASKEKLLIYEDIWQNATVQIQHLIELKQWLNGLTLLTK